MSDRGREALAAALAMRKTKHALYAHAPMICKGDASPCAASCSLAQNAIAPEGERCHPPGTLVYTVSDGYVPIEKLDPDKHKLISFERRTHYIRQGSTKSKKGYSFRIASRDFSGTMIRISTQSGYRHDATYDHISVARFNEKAVGKFCVYLMRKGDFWRVGMTRLVAEYKDSSRGHRTYMPFVGRANAEEADDMWILGVYDTHAEAYFAEERFSLETGTSRLSFSCSLDKYNSKYNGVYRWATQEQIDDHHESLKRPPCFYREFLESLGLSIDYPFWRRGGFGDHRPETGPYVRWPMFIRACNILPEVMDVPVYDPNHVEKFSHPKGYKKASWEAVLTNPYHYEGKVYSLDVDGKHKTYFAGGIATHNCPIEIVAITEFFNRYCKELEVDVDNMVDLGLVRELAEVETQLERVANRLAQEDMIVQVAVGVDREGDPIVRPEIHKAFDIQDRLRTRKDRILDQLHATRKAKNKGKDPDNIDPSTRAAELIAKAKQLREAMETMDRVVEVDP